MALSKKLRSRVVFGLTGALTVPGGIAKANLNVMRALDDLTRENESELSVFSLLESNHERPRFLSSPVKFTGFKGSKRRFAAELLRTIPHNTLFCFDHVSLSLPLLPFVKAGVTRTVIFNHGSESWKRIQRLNRLSIQLATKCLTNSNYTLRKMQEHIGPFNGVSCPLGLPEDFPLNSRVVERNGIPLQLTAADGSLQTIGPRMLLLVARMLSSERQKGHRQLIEVIPELLKRYPDVQVVFAGDGDDRSLFGEMIQKSATSSAVFLPGFVSPDMLRTLYQCCFAFVMPSMQEGFGLAYLEAMNFAKPCVGCLNQGTEDIVLRGQTGYLLRNQSDRSELINTLSQLLDDPVKASELGHNGFDRLHREFTAVHHQNRIKQQIAPLIASPFTNA